MLQSPFIVTPLAFCCPLNRNTNNQVKHNPRFKIIQGVLGTAAPSPPAPRGKHSNLPVLLCVTQKSEPFYCNYYYYLIKTARLILVLSPFARKREDTGEGSLQPLALRAGPVITAGNLGFLRHLSAFPVSFSHPSKRPQPLGDKIPFSASLLGCCV